MSACLLDIEFVLDTYAVRLFFATSYSTFFLFSSITLVGEANNPSSDESQKKTLVHFCDILPCI